MIHTILLKFMFPSTESKFYETKSVYILYKFGQDKVSEQGIKKERGL